MNFIKEPCLIEQICMARSNLSEMSVFKKINKKKVARKSLRGVWQLHTTLLVLFRLMKGISLTFN